MRKTLCIILLSVIIAGCNNKRNSSAEREYWIEKPVPEWPVITLTNNVCFTDTSFSEIANAFLIDTGYDTLAVTCKHIFLAFKNRGLSHIDPGESLNEWFLSRKGQNYKSVELNRMININPGEEIGEFNTLKSRDWIIFPLKEINDTIFPLKIRTAPLRKHEIIFALGWSHNQQTDFPALIKMQVFDNMGNYCYVTTLSEDIGSQGRSGSPVIDSNGHLVGLVSGQEGELGVVAATTYLTGLFGQYNIPYKKQD